MKCSLEGQYQKVEPKHLPLVSVAKSRRPAAISAIELQICKAQH